MKLFDKSLRCLSQKIFKAKVYVLFVFVKVLVPLIGSRSEGFFNPYQIRLTCVLLNLAELLKQVVGLVYWARIAVIRNHKS